MNLPSMKSILLFLLLIPTLVFAQDDLGTVPPTRKPNFSESAIPLPNSVINLPLQFRFDAIERRINNEFKGVLFNDSSFDDNNHDNLMLKITKIAPIKFKVIKDSLVITAPVHIWINYRYENNSLSSTFGTDALSISTTKDANFYVDVMFGTKLFITGDWRVFTKTIGTYKWRQSPVLEVSGVKIPIERMVNSTFQKQINDYAASIDKDFPKDYPVKDMMTKFWYEYQTPFKISDEYNTYLNLSPSAISYMPFQTDNNTLKTGIKITTKIEANVGQFNLTDKKFTPLPTLYRALQPANTFDVWLKSGITYNDLTGLAVKMVKDSTFKDEDGKTEATIRDISIAGSRDVLEVKVSLEGFTKKTLFKKNFKGDVYLRGVPVFDSVKNEIRLTNVDFDLNSKDVLLKTTSALFANKLKKMLEQNLVFNVTSTLNDTKKELNTTLQQFDTDFIRFNGKVDKLRIDKIYLTDEGIRMILNVKGNIQGTLR